MTLKKCKKVSYSLLDVILGCTSIALIILLVYSFTWINKYDLFISVKHYIPIGLLFFMQLFTLLIFWIGCKGIWTENLFIIKILCALLVLKIIVEIGVGVWIFMLRDDVDEILDNNMKYSFKNYTTHKYNKAEWNFIQYQLQCCGINGPTSFAEYEVDYIPTSCCNITKANETCHEGFYQAGCKNVLTKYVRDIFLFLGQAVFFYIGIQIIGLAIFTNLKILLAPNETSNTPEDKPLQPQTKDDLNLYS